MAKSSDFADGLGEVGIFVPKEPGLFDFTAALATTMRSWYGNNRGTHTDLGEMALLAGVEAVTEIVGERVQGLFPSANEFQNAVRSFSTKNGFAQLTHEFFARFLRRFLLYHLSRELSQHVGGNGRFADAKAHTTFLAELDTHCREAALIVKAFAGKWYDKNFAKNGISEQKAQGFSLHCLRDKLAPELVMRGRRHG